MNELLDHDHAPELTKREKEIVKLLLQGHTYNEIATSCCIGIETVRTHLKKIYRKFKVRGRCELAWRVLNGDA